MAHFSAFLTLFSSFLCMIAMPSSALDVLFDAQQWSVVEALSEQLTEHAFPQVGSKEKDLITVLPGQPGNVSFAQYSGYIAIDPAGARNLFYYFVEAASDPSSKPLVWWSNGGPGASSLGIGALQGHGPFHVDPSGEALVSNPYSWNNVANMLYVESPYGAGFSYSTNESDYFSMGDDIAAVDNFRFLENWLERFPEYQSRDLYLAGQNAGTFISQLAEFIVFHNNNKAENIINLKGIILGNPSIDNVEDLRGRFTFHAGHGIISDQKIGDVDRGCNCKGCWNSTECFRALALSRPFTFTYNIGDIYDLPCHDPHYTDPFFNEPSELYNCRRSWTTNYLNLPDVQSAFHVNVSALTSPWVQFNMDIDGAYNQRYGSIIPMLKNVLAGRIPIWIYGGDLDSRNPITSTIYSLRLLNLKVKTPWRGWYSTPIELAGYVVQYKGNLTFITVRAAGQSIVQKQPVRALLMFTSIIQGQSLPYSPFLHY